MGNNNYFLFFYNTHKYKATTAKGLFILADLAKLVLHVNHTEMLATRIVRSFTHEKTFTFLITFSI